MSEQELMNDDAAREFDPEQQAVERMLGGMVPVRPSFDAAAVISASVLRSQESARAAHRQIWLWRGVAAALAASLALMVWIHRAPRSTEREMVKREDPIIRVSPTPAPTEAAAPASASPDYLLLRRKVLARGVDVLDDEPAHSETIERTDDSPIRWLRSAAAGGT